MTDLSASFGEDKRRGRTSSGLYYGGEPIAELAVGWATFSIRGQAPSKVGFAKQVFQPSLPQGKNGRGRPFIPPPVVAAIGAKTDLVYGRIFSRQLLASTCMPTVGS